MRINTNVSAIQAATSLGRVQNALSDSIQKLSSGLRINKASDDAAGLGIANTLRAGTRVLTQAARNGEQASAMLNVAEGGASAIESIVERMKELAAQSASANSGDRTQLQAEFATLSTEIDRITGTTDYQGTKLINGTMGNTATTGTLISAAPADFVVGSAALSGSKAGTYTFAESVSGKLTLSDATRSQTVDVVAGAQTVSFSDFGISFKTTSAFAVAGVTFNAKTLIVTAGSTGADFLVSGTAGQYGATGTQDLVSLATAVSLGATALGIGSSDISTQSGAQTALGSLDTAISTVNSALGAIGAAQSRIGFALDNTKTAIANFTAAESTIRDVDMASEMTNFSKNQILAQAGTAMLAQANQSTQSVLKLFQ